VIAAAASQASSALTGQRSVRPTGSRPSCRAGPDRACAREIRLDAIRVAHNLACLEPGDLARPQCRGEADEEQRPSRNPGSASGMVSRAERGRSSTKAVFSLTGDGARLIPAKVQVADRHCLVQAQGIDGEVAVGLSGGKGGDRLQGGLQYCLVVDRAPGGEAHPSRAVGVPRVFSARDARRVLMAASAASPRVTTGTGSLEVEPALQVLGRGAGRDGFGNSVRSGRLLSGRLGSRTAHRRWVSLRADDR